MTRSTRYEPHLLDRRRGPRDAVPRPDLGADPGHPGAQGDVPEQLVDRPSQILVGERVGRQPPPEPRLVVLFPPWVITRSTSGTIEVCGRNSEPHMFGASSYWSCCGPFETM